MLLYVYVAGNWGISGIAKAIGEMPRQLRKFKFNNIKFLEKKFWG